MGPFQLAGVSSACMAGATVGASNELLMTGSNASTVSYALPSNPGTGCTGTMKFPDVRQFDERVYQSDSGTPISGGLPAGGGGTGGIAPPAGLVASVR
jgi:hypothetical protein